MPARVITMREGSPRVDRIITGDGKIQLVRPFDLGPEPPEYVELAFTRQQVPDTSIAFYLRAGEQVTLGILTEALGEDWVVDDWGGGGF